jgi:membrane-associated protein
MDTLALLVDLVVHLDRHLNGLIANYGLWTYAILFAVIFCETGLVVTPFLPGDSLLFAVGALAAAGPPLEWHWLFLLLSVAAIAGDTVNYWIGARTGPRVFTDRVRWLKREHLLRTRDFYERHGGKTIILARFVPFLRTFAPFVAGIGTMSYRRFLAYNVTGGVAWIGLFVGAGYLVGNIPVVKDNFSFVVLGIILLSVMPIVFEVVRARRQRAPEAGS